MKKLLILLLLISSVSNAQYYSERTTEQSFESSTLFFNSHYLNTYGIYKFKDAAVGLIDDPFLNAYLNPAFIPDLGNKEFLIHIDFRGDNTEPEVLKTYVQPADYLASSIYISRYADPRWFSNTRTEPEPVISLGFLMYPGGKGEKNLYVGGSYQLILSDEDFYEMPFSIYEKNINYDAFNTRIAENAVYIDHSISTNEMLNEAHLLSLFSGYRVNSRLSAGIFLNSVMHNRDGAIGNNGMYYLDPYANAILNEREQNYNHFDFGAGINYKTDGGLLAGVKAGLLIGNADQNYYSESNFYYKNNEPEESETWNYNYSRYTENQDWNQDGTTYYAGINLTKEFDTGSRINLYYRFTGSDISTTTNSVINDTLFYSSKYYNDYENEYTLSNRRSSLHDLRKGSGSRDKIRHEFMFNVNWLVSDQVNIYAGLYVKRDNYKIDINEPVTVKRFSYSHDESTPGNYNYTNNTASSETKKINWNYEAKTWTLQIPVLVNVSVNKYWGFMVGLNRILDAWNVDDITTSHIKNRYRFSNGNETSEKNIIERFRQPDKRITEDKFDFIASVNGNISDELRLRLILNPEFEDKISLDQWWLSFNAGF